MYVQGCLRCLTCVFSLISIWGVPSLDQCWGSKGLCSRRQCCSKIEPFIEQSTSRNAKWTQRASPLFVYLWVLFALVVSSWFLNISYDIIQVKNHVHLWKLGLEVAWKVKGKKPEYGLFAWDWPGFTRLLQGWKLAKNLGWTRQQDSSAKLAHTDCTMPNWPI